MYTGCNGANYGQPLQNDSIKFMLISVRHIEANYDGRSIHIQNILRAYDKWIREKCCVEFAAAAIIERLRMVAPEMLRSHYVATV